MESSAGAAGHPIRDLGGRPQVAIVGAGIVGLAHAYLAARAGNRVTVFERSPAAHGASIRNFGMIWPIGQPAGPLHQMALRSRALWLEVLQVARLPYFASGSLHAAYRDDEVAVGREFCERGPALGYECQWLSPRSALEKSQVLREEGLFGAVWSPTELTVDPRQVVASLPQFLSDYYGVRFYFNSAVHSVESGRLHTSTGPCAADMIIVASGDDFQSLFPECFHEPRLTRSKLQMMRTSPQPTGWKLGPSLAFGLTFTHYPTFQICNTLPALKTRIAQETPELARWGVHVMASQNSRGEVTLGDSHEYGLEVDIFDKPAINRMILEFAQTYMRLPCFEIAEQWHGVYAKHPDRAYQRVSPLRDVHVVTVTSGIGMTMSFGIAEETMHLIGAAA